MEQNKSLINVGYIDEIKELLRAAKQTVTTTINVAMVYTYYEIGRRIVEQEQKGKDRAEYGKEILKQLSISLTKEFGKGYSISNLKTIRQFYIIYSNDKIQQTVFGESQDQKSETVFTNSQNQIGQTVFSQFKNYPLTNDGKRFFLSWGHYIRLMRIKNVNERHFYEIECFTNRWSVREYDRQYDSCLYERLAASRDKQGVLELAQKGQKIEKPMDAIKEPYILNFLELKEDHRYSEKEVETRIINKLQDFMMELGKGFTFVGRQVRLTFDEQHFFADLVFYNRLLRCFVVIDLKNGKLKHQDIGQMQMYVNYYDRYVKLPEENKTIGILLCREKNDSVVNMTLPEGNDQIFAGKYETILPSKNELKKIIEE